MKIVILDEFSLSQYNLPLKIEESYPISYKQNGSNAETRINIEAIDGKWRLKSSNDFSIKQGNATVPSISLDNYSFSEIYIPEQPGFKLLYALPSVDQNTYKLSVTPGSQIRIGLTPDNNISYNNIYMKPTHAVIQSNNNLWFVVPSNEPDCYVYVNNKRIKQQKKLDLGDVIFIHGLKIIWMGEFIKINNPRGVVSVNGMNQYTSMDGFDNTRYDDSLVEGNIELYTDAEYFYHSPRLITTIVDEEVTIDQPPQQEIREELPLVLTLGTSITMMSSSAVMIYNILVSLSAGGKSFKDYIPQIFMCVSMIIGSLLMPRITNMYQKRQSKKKEKKRQEKFSAYLKDKENKINLIMKNQVQILNENNKTVTELSRHVIQGSRIVWEREITDEDFLTVRLGIGNTNARLSIQSPQEHFKMEEDNLEKMIYEVVNKSRVLNNVPITLSLLDKRVSAIITQCSYKDDYIKGILLQIIALHSASDLKIVLLTNEEGSLKYDYLKKLPHLWSDDKSIRFFASNREEIREVVSYLDKINKERMEKANSNTQEEGTDVKIKDYKGMPPYYLVITDNYRDIKDNSFIESILSSERNYGFSTLVIDTSMQNIPPECKSFVQVLEKDGCVMEREVNQQNQNMFVPEYVSDLDMDILTSKISNIPLTTKDIEQTLPQSLTFLEMFNVSKIEQLNILNRWQVNNPVSSLATTVGVHANREEFKLDLHEKFHGPHGLIAGTSGSGKSEFIITFILSMAINYHPYEVQFVLIDYKGGGLAGAFENRELGIRIPHLVGTITNLDISEMNRTLVSIESEMKRRQMKFNKVRDSLGEGTIDIYKYQRLYREGVVKEPMAHLFIISDEFAELKQQQPDFMQQLISTARIGRSLGIHLILATQKPTGVVNDQIWSNSKFKVCLKVQDRSDSMEMLKRPDAASIKEAGRFCLQIGYDDYFAMGQSGWSGAKYVPTDTIVKKVNDSIDFVNNIGNIYKSINNTPKEKKQVEDIGDQLTNTVKYINNLATKEKISTSKLWLDKIPDEIFLNELIQKYNYRPSQYLISPVIGEYDNPKQQEQGLLNLEMTKYGNVLIYGQNGSGKENLLSTIIWSSMTEHTPEEINYYIIDCGAESLKMFHRIPHVGEVITIDEPDKMVELFAMMEDDLEKRKDLFADYAGNYVNYLENSGEKLPMIVCIINNWDVFQENFMKYSENLQPFFRDGSKYGINFIITTTTSNAVRNRMAQNFPIKITMQLPNTQDYRTLINSPKELIPAKAFGRGLITKNDTAYEFQTAFICDKKNISNAVRSAAEQLEKAYTVRAKKIPTVPEVVTLNTVLNDKNSFNNFPIGYDMNTKKVSYYDFIANKYNMILFDKIEDKVSFVNAFLKLIKSFNKPNDKIIIIDLIKLLETHEEFEYYNDNFTNVLVQLNNLVMNEKEDDEVNKIVIFLGIGQIKNVVNKGVTKILNNLFTAEEKLSKYTFILMDSYILFKNVQIEPWCQEQFDSNNGIWIGENFASQMAINMPKLEAEERKISYPYLGVKVTNGNHEFIKHIVDEVAKDEK